MKNSQGAALLLVLAVMSVVSVLLMHAWFVASCAYDVALGREHWYKNCYATEAIMNVGIIRIIPQFKQIKRMCTLQKEPIELDVSDIFAQYKVEQPLANEIRGLCTVQLPKDPVITRGLVVCAQYLQNDKCVAQHRCLVTKFSVRTNTIKEQRFVISHYSIGTAI